MHIFLSHQLNTKKNKHSFFRTTKEGLTLLRWKEGGVRLTVYLRLDHRLPVGGGRVIHRYGKHIILLHPRPSQSFPWNTVRHELLHAMLKSKIRSKLRRYKIPLPTPKTYTSQTFRENLEEYCVRALQILFLQQKNGLQWGQKQIVRELQQGFLLMPIFVRFFQQWQKTKKPFSRNTFIELVHFLN